MLSTEKYVFILLHATEILLNSPSAHFRTTFLVIAPSGSFLIIKKRTDASRECQTDFVV